MFATRGRRTETLPPSTASPGAEPADGVSTTGIEPPFTRLVTNAGYVAPKLPGRVPCSELNYTGGLYYYLATETFCE